MATRSAITLLSGLVPAALLTVSASANQGATASGSVEILEGERLSVSSIAPDEKVLAKLGRVASFSRMEVEVAPCMENTRSCSTDRKVIVRMVDFQ